MGRIPDGLLLGTIILICIVIVIVVVSIIVVVIIILYIQRETQQRFLSRLPLCGATRVETMTFEKGCCLSEHRS